MIASVVVRSIRQFSSTAVQRCVPRNPIIQLNKAKVRKHGIRNPDAIKPFQWHSLFLLPLPLVTFYLGIWQLQRMKWKQELIAKLKAEGREDIQLRDEHFNYAVTWFSVSVTTAIMWAMRYLRR